jgi:hypothetical protein
VTSAGPPAAAGAAAPPRLRVALLLDSFVVPAWIHRVVSELRAGTDAELALVVLDDTPARSRRGILARAWHDRHTLAYALYTKLDDLLYGRPEDALAPHDLSAPLAGVPVLRVRPERTDSSDRLADRDVEAIRAYDLDVSLRLGFHRLGGGALRIARHGAWAVRYGQDGDARSGPPGFWEVADGAPATATALQVLGDGPEAGTTLYRSWSFTDPRSVRCNRSESSWKSAAFFARALRALRARGPAPLAPGPGPLRVGPADARSEALPGNAETLGAALRIGARFLRDRWLRLFFLEQWALAISTETRFPPVMRSFRELLPPKDRIWADPFLFEHAGRCHVFFEECLAGSPRAHLSVMERREDGSFTPPRTVLERPYHLSYPFVFSWNGEIWMLPETSENRTVELYRCVEFPDRWTLDRVLLQHVSACDATLHEQDGRWWMFVSMAAAGARMFDELHLFHAQSPLGPWQPVAGNPVRSDVRNARPAGRLFRRDGRWIRPAQDGSGRYGRAIHFRRVERLDLEGYAESEGGVLEPDWSRSAVGTHTWNAAGSLAAIDFIKRRRRFW